MKIHKTSKNERSIYRYPISSPDGKGGYITEYITIKPGEDGVTEADIKMLHSLDDSEVYYNLKNMHGKTDEQEKIKEWREHFIADFIKHHGYAPNKADVDYFQKERFPSNWNLSLDYLSDNDKNHMLFETAETEEDNYIIEKFYEAMKGLTDKQRDVLRMVKLEGYSLTETAQILGTSIPNVKKHLERALKNFEKNFKEVKKPT